MRFKPRAPFLDPMAHGQLDTSPSKCLHQGLNPSHLFSYSPRSATSSSCLDVDSTVQIFPPSTDPMTVVLPPELALLPFPWKIFDASKASTFDDSLASPVPLGLICVIEMLPLLSFVNSETSKGFLCALFLRFLF
jgi:hypothetical protein